MLGTGATEIRKADYASQGLYFQSFTGLSTGLERIGKLCLILDYYIDNAGAFPPADLFSKKFRHDLIALYNASKDILRKRPLAFRFDPDLDDPILQKIIGILSRFAKGDRYSNIDLLVGNRDYADPIAEWFKSVDSAIFKQIVPLKKRVLIRLNAQKVGHLMDGFASIHHTAEEGTAISDFEEASFRTGMQEAVAPHRQLLVLKILRYWTELIWHLQTKAQGLGREEIPYFSEIFAPFYNSDSFFKGRKIW